MKNSASRFFVLGVFLLFSIPSIYGQRCLSDHLRQERIAANPDLVEQVAGIERFTQKWIAENYGNYRDGNVAVTLPVVVHVLYRLPEENISDEQIQSQMVVLNDDFRKLNTNIGNTPAPFLALAADIEMEFCLATTAPDGSPSTGIVRTEVSTDNIGTTLDYFDGNYGGSAAWDITKYINIWVCDIGDDGTLGFATPPGTADPPESDGLVIAPQFFGTTGTAASSQPNHLGRTVTHEMGHYFNLEHLWGPGDGGCDEDDMVADTPLQQTESSGCPSFPFTDNCTPSGDGIMFMNYMDYTDDDCMAMFSEGQKGRMLAALNGPRASLLASQICEQMTAVVEEQTSAFTLFPNPAQKECTVQFENPPSGKIQMEIFDLSGRSIWERQMEASVKTSISLDGIGPGIYMVKVSTGKHISMSKLAILKTAN